MESLQFATLSQQDAAPGSFNKNQVYSRARQYTARF